MPRPFRSEIPSETPAPNFAPLLGDPRSPADVPGERERAADERVAPPSNSAARVATPQRGRRRRRRMKAARPCAKSGSRLRTARTGRRRRTARSALLPQGLWAWPPREPWQGPRCCHGWHTGSRKSAVPHQARSVNTSKAQTSLSSFRALERLCARDCRCASTRSPSRPRSVAKFGIGRVRLLAPLHRPARPATKTN